MEALRGKDQACHYRSVEERRPSFLAALEGL
jgi:hypothetical protein